MLSFAVAETVTVPDTVAPDAGEEIETAGAMVSVVPPNSTAPISGAIPEKYPEAIPGRAGYVMPPTVQDLERSIPLSIARLPVSNLKSGIVVTFHIFWSL